MQILKYLAFVPVLLPWGLMAYVLVKTTYNVVRGERNED